MTRGKLYFASDYMEGAHPNILRRLVETNLEHTTGYGCDEFTLSAKERVRKACACPDAAVHFLVGGTQTNATTIAAILRSYQGVVSVDSGHVTAHEAGAIEYCGHKVLTLPGKTGKLAADQIGAYLEAFHADGKREHSVMPGIVYLSQPTEYGTLYSLSELTAISETCRRFRIPLYVDGARLAYALASPENDASLADLARLCDAFYIGGTKCGAFCGEAVVVPDPEIIAHFFTIIKQHGALMAKGRFLGLQFDELFKDDLYMHIGESAVRYAGLIQSELQKNGRRFLFHSPTNQTFLIVDDSELAPLAEKVEFGFWEKYDETRSVIRFATSWATTLQDVEALIALMKE